MLTAVEVARNLNTYAAGLKDWRLRKIDKRAREIAVMALTSDCLIGTAKEIGERFPELCVGRKMDAVADHKPEEIFVWAIDPEFMGNGRVRLGLGAVDVYRGELPILWK